MKRRNRRRNTATRDEEPTGTGLEDLTFLSLVTAAKEEQRVHDGTRIAHLRVRTHERQMLCTLAGMLVAV